MNGNRGTIPVGFFGIAVGALALANLWRVAIKVWHLPAEIGPLMTVVALAVWLVVLVAYGHKWLTNADEARAEMQHPVQSSFAALVPVSSLLAAQLLQPYAHTLALAIFAVAMVVQLALGVYLHGRLWQGGRKPELTTPAMYLPSVASSFVAGTAAASFGFHQLGVLFFGAGLFSWLAIESMLLHRASVLEPLPAALRPVLGIQLAPPVVGGVTYLSLTSGTPDLFALMLLGYGLYQAVMLLRLLPWIRQQAFVPGLLGLQLRRGRTADDGCPDGRTRCGGSDRMGRTDSVYRRECDHRRSRSKDRELAGARQAASGGCYTGSVGDANAGRFAHRPESLSRQVFKRQQFERGA